MLFENKYLDLNKFIKLEEIGEGSFSKAYKIQDKETKNILCCKILKFSLDQAKINEKQQLIREISILSDMNHPSILKFIGFSPNNFDQLPHPTIITEYLQNGTLRNIIQLEKLSKAPNCWDDTHKLITIYGIASAMSFLHSHKVLHRDLKPENILMDDFLFPKIADFGYSKINHQNAESITFQSEKNTKGTSAYISPEGWKAEYRLESDIYSFAIIIYELLTLDQPFENFDTYSICYFVTIKNDRPKIKKSMPRCYRNLITQCWASRPEERPTFQHILDELKYNPDFITTKNINEQDFHNYINYIENPNIFDPTSVFQKAILSEQTDPISNSSNESNPFQEFISKHQLSDERQMILWQFHRQREAIPLEDLYLFYELNNFDEQKLSDFLETW